MNVLVDNKKQLILRTVLKSFFCFSVFLWLGLVKFVYIKTGLPRLVPMAGLNLRTSFDPTLPASADRLKFKGELLPLIKSIKTEEGQVLEILKWVMNQVPKIENGESKGSWSMVEQGRLGKGQLCSGMAQLLKDALLSVNIPARKVIFQRNLFDRFDTHVSVEAWIGGRWRLYDPSYHIIFTSNGETVGVDQARSWFVQGKGNLVEMKFLGEVKYPSRIENSIVNYPILFNNSYVEMHRDIFIIEKIPHLKGWLGWEMAYPVETNGLSTRGLNFHRFLYFLTFLGLPSLCLFLAGLMLFFKKNNYF